MKTLMPWPARAKMFNQVQLTVLAAVALAVFNSSAIAQPFELDDRILTRWSNTASGTTLSETGTPVTLTWGIAPDGTQVPDGANPAAFAASNLISEFDTAFNEVNLGADLTQRTWFTPLQQSADRIAELSGVTYVFEAADDGVDFSAGRAGAPRAQGRGVLGTRADVRVGGRSVDGANGTLAFNYFPEDGDQVLDTDDVGFFDNPNNDYRALRNVFTHELLHGLGFGHVISNDASFLEEPFIFANPAFDGPQLDDILLLQRTYGDPLEKANAGAGNDTRANAVALGSLTLLDLLDVGQTVDDTVISGNETGFLSIDGSNDSDFFSFTIEQGEEVSFELTPEGASYTQAPQQDPQPAGTLIDTAALNDLSFVVTNLAGQTVASGNQTGTGALESDAQNLAAGTYFVEVSGADDNVQLYNLAIRGDLNVASVPEPGSVALLGLTATCWWTRRRRR